MTLARKSGRGTWKHARTPPPESMCLTRKTALSQSLPSLCNPPPPSRIYYSISSRLWTGQVERGQHGAPRRGFPSDGLGVNLLNQLITNGHEFGILPSLGLHGGLQAGDTQLGLVQLGPGGGELSVQVRLEPINLRIGLGQLLFGVRPQGLVPPIRVGQVRL